jgi:hypothetical protein
MARALAVNYWHQGADGIYTFNLSAHTYVHRPERESKFKHLMDLVREIDDPEAMRGKDKLFAADRGRPSWTYPHSWMHCVLPVTLEAGGQVKVPILVGEDVTRPPAPKLVELRVGLGEESDGAAFKVSLNGQPLPDLERADSSSTGIACPPPQCASVMTCSLNPEQVTVGRNEVGISVAEGELNVSAVEIRVSY